ncbi:unnamed protein product [Strongylus vulgaris]|uniref:Neurotransmitter-gated ion-channel transmembrane domain-containing protein n=1 Tax=Strongylus vulgaris TaxID=40348 RepID=A0A3P7LF08_STRVU|nr:unnamed protein product [Strongylus vulgaris]
MLTDAHFRYYDCCPNPYPDISYFFAIKRNPSYYLFTLIIPSAFITIVTVIGFFTPHSSTGENTEKVSLGVTALLSLAIILMMVSDKLPATSNSVPLLGKFSGDFQTSGTQKIGRPISRRVRGFLLSIRVNKSSLLQWFFGKELMNTQETIKMRLKKYIYLLRSVLHWTDIHNVSGYLLYNFYPGLTNARKCRSTNLTSSSWISAFYSREQVFAITMHPKLPLIDEDTPEEMAKKIGDPVLHNMIIDLLESVQCIRQEMLMQEHVKRIRREWQMLARMLEKMIMWLFIICTIIFASVMLYDSQDPPIITDELMKERAK